jgi:hypothetical protein
MMGDTQSNPDAISTNRVSAWLKRNRTRLQALMLVLTLSAPFGLYWALQSERDGIAAACFAITATSLITVIIVG